MTYEKISETELEETTEPTPNKTKYKLIDMIARAKSIDERIAKLQQEKEWVLKIIEECKARGIVEKVETEEI